MKTIAQQLNVKEFPFIIYDNNENQIYHEDSYGYWCKSEYNSNGNVIYFENSKGCWDKYKYDSNGNRIYFENSEGLWCKREYDYKGNKIYYEDSDGVIRDNRPKSCEGKIIEIDGVEYELKIKN